MEIKIAMDDTITIGINENNILEKSNERLSITARK